MRIVQVATTAGRPCGVGCFALNLEEALKSKGVEVRTVTKLVPPMEADLLLVQHGWQLFDDDELQNYCSGVSSPLAIFAHYRGAERFENVVDGFVTLAPGLLSRVAVPVLSIPTPAWVPRALQNRATLKKQLGLPDATVVGSCGFLTAEREFSAILGRLLPVARQNGWFVDLVTSRWYRGSPAGMEETLQELAGKFPGSCRFGTSYLPREELNRRLQACDILWCWTSATSKPYGSASISDQYASGTRIYAADKEQHEHVLRLPNVVRGPSDRDAFVDGLIEEIRGGHFHRHDTSPVAWERVSGAIAHFAKTLAVA